jgi:hypothetical protein
MTTTSHGKAPNHPATRKEAARTRPALPAGPDYWPMPPRHGSPRLRETAAGPRPQAQTAGSSTGCRVTQ